LRVLATARAHGEGDSMLKFYFNRNALEALAKELRRASWGIAVAAAASGIKWDTTSGWLLLGAAVAWVVLQGVAVALESLTNGRSNRK
jgi:thiosulfate reductase cytochrome b subunit